MDTGSGGPLGNSSGPIISTNPLATFLPSIIDSGNTTSSTLGGGATFTGTFTDVLGFTQIIVRAEADVVGTCFIEFSTDGQNVLGNPVQVNDNDQTSVFQIVDLTPTVQYYRLRYLNGASAQSSFTLSARLNRVAGTLTNSATQTVNDYTRVVTVRQITDPFLDEVSGRQANRSTIQKFGANPDVAQATLEDIWTVGGTYNWLTAASAVRIKAGGNAADDAGGAGALTVVVEGLDQDWNEASETLTTAGASVSAATTTTFIRVFRAYVATAGAYTATNVGNIDIETTGGTTVARIGLTSSGAGVGQTQLAIYTVPAGKIAYIRAVRGSVQGSKDADLIFFQRANADDVTGPSYSSKRVIHDVLGFSGRFEDNFKTYLGPFAAKTDLWAAGVGPSGGSRMSAEMDIVLVDA